MASFRKPIKALLREHLFVPIVENLRVSFERGKKYLFESDLFSLAYLPHCCSGFIFLSIKAQKGRLFLFFSVFFCFFFYRTDLYMLYIELCKSGTSGTLSSCISWILLKRTKKYKSFFVSFGWGFCFDLSKSPAPTNQKKSRDLLTPTPHHQLIRSGWKKHGHCIILFCECECG